MVYLPLALGRDCTTSPYLASLESLDKRHIHNLFHSTHLRTQLLGAISWKNALDNNFISAPPTCPKLQWLVPPNPSQTSLTTSCSSGHRPQLLPYLTWLLASSPSKAWQKLFSFLVSPFRSGTRILVCTFCPAIGPWLSLLTDQEPIGEQDLSIRTAPPHPQETTCSNLQAHRGQFISKP